MNFRPELEVLSSSYLNDDKFEVVLPLSAMKANPNLYNSNPNEANRTANRANRSAIQVNLVLIRLTGMVFVANWSVFRLKNGNSTF